MALSVKSFVLITPLPRLYSAILKPNSILRDIDTGDVLGLAPNFDNNMALISRGYPKNIKRKNDILLSLFNELLEFDNRLKKYIPPLTEEIILKVIKSVGMRVRS